MRAIFALAALSALTTSLAACPGPPAESCGQSTVLPTADEVTDGRGTATRSDGEAFDEAGSWALAPSSSIVIGLLTMIIATDETGTSVDELIESAAFPICIPQGARSETSGQANLSAFVTDADHDGGVAILAKDGNTLTGRFSFEMASQAGETLTFSDGVFQIPLR